MFQIQLLPVITKSVNTNYRLLQRFSLAKAFDWLEAKEKKSGNTNPGNANNHEAPGGNF